MQLIFTGELLAVYNDSLGACSRYGISSCYDGKLSGNHGSWVECPRVDARHPYAGESSGRLRRKTEMRAARRIFDSAIYVVT